MSNKVQPPPVDLLHGNKTAKLREAFSVAELGSNRYGVIRIMFNPKSLESAKAEIIEEYNNIRDAEVGFKINVGKTIFNR